MVSEGFGKGFFIGLCRVNPFVTAALIACEGIMHQPPTPRSPSPQSHEVCEEYLYPTLWTRSEKRVPELQNRKNPH
jgi:hypothetical protein